MYRNVLFRNFNAGIIGSVIFALHIFILFIVFYFKFNPFPKFLEYYFGLIFILVILFLSLFPFAQLKETNELFFHPSLLGWVVSFVFWIFVGFIFGIFTAKLLRSIRNKVLSLKNGPDGSRDRYLGSFNFLKTKLK